MRNRQISIKVAGEKWKVIFKKPTEEDYIGVEEDDIGLCVAEERKIYVDPDPDTVVSTFLHEVLHAVFPQLSDCPNGSKRGLNRHVAKIRAILRTLQDAAIHAGFDYESDPKS